MTYGDNTQYGNFQFQFGNLSPIVEAALERKKKQAQQQQSMISSIGKLAGQYAASRSPDANGPGPSDVSTPGYTMSDAVAGSADPSQYRITSYGPESSSPTPADYNETIGARDNVLRPGDVAVSPDMRSQFPLGSHLRIGTSPDVYTVSDFTNPRLHRRVDIWNGQDMGNQPVYGYSQGGVVPLPENAEGVLGWRTWPDFNARRGNESLEQLSNVPAQHFASGGVASFTDPYGDRKSQYAEHLGPMADVQGIAGVIARQRMFQQEQNQQNISQAMQAANKLMQQRQSDEIANKVLSQLPSYGVNTSGFEGQGQQGLAAVQQLYGLQQQQDTRANQAEDRANKQYSQGLRDLATEDKYVNQGTSSSPNGLDIQTDPDTGEKFYRTSRGGWSHIKGSNQQQSGAPDTGTTFDEYGREWRKGAKGNMILVPKGQAITTDQLPTYEEQTVTPDTGLPSPQAGSQTGTAPPIVRQDQLPSPNKANAGSLKQEALDAIKRGADPEAVRARYRQLSGSDL